MTFGTGSELKAPKVQAGWAMLAASALGVIALAAPGGCFLDTGGVGGGGSGGMTSSTSSSSTGGANSCNTASDCSGSGPCKTMVCPNHVCESQQAAAGTPCTESTGKTGVCDGMGICTTCTDGMKDGSETDTDCGGPQCSPCAPNQACLVADDCTSHVCTSNSCAPPSCTDSVQNGNETATDCGGGTCPRCGIGEACFVTSDCAASVCDAGACRVAHSCNELHGVQPALPDGVYAIDFNGTAALTSVFCDMTTDGGGWTALINPVKGSLPGTVASLVTSTVDLSGVQQCLDPPPPSVVKGNNGFWGVQVYGCGTLTFKLTVSWANALGAKDLMFAAVVQGDVTHTILLDGTSIPSDVSDAGGNCFSWNGTASLPTPGINTCWSSTLSAPAHVYDGQLNGDLELELSSGPGSKGPGGTTNYGYGTGMNIQKLSVR